jgi:hypothetical protein
VDSERAHVNDGGKCWDSDGKTSVNAADAYHPSLNRNLLMKSIDFFKLMSQISFPQDTIYGNMTGNRTDSKKNKTVFF